MPNRTLEECFRLLDEQRVAHEQQVADQEKRFKAIEARQQTVWQVLIAHGRRLTKLDGIDPEG